MISSLEIISKYAVPWIGVVIGNIMYSAPWKDVLDATITGELGDLNPLPWAFMIGNCFGWIVYGILVNDVSIVAGSAPGFLFSIWLNLQAVKLLYTKTKDVRKAQVLINPNEGIAFSASHIIPKSPEIKGDIPILRSPLLTENGSVNFDETSVADVDVESTTATTESDFVLPIAANLDRLTILMSQMQMILSQERVVLFLATVWLLIVLLLAFVPTLTNEVKVLIVGFAVNMNLIGYYCAPLSTIHIVFKKKASDTIHRATMALNIITCTFWGVYGIVVLDPFLIFPSGVGFLLGLAQLLMCLLFPRKQERAKGS